MMASQIKGVRKRLVLGSWKTPDPRSADARGHLCARAPGFLEVGPKSSIISLCFQLMVHIPLPDLWGINK